MCASLKFGDSLRPDTLLQCHGLWSWHKVSSLNVLHWFLHGNTPPHYSNYRPRRGRRVHVHEKASGQDKQDELMRSVQEGANSTTMRASSRFAGKKLERYAFAVIVIIFIGLSLVYNVATPAGEGVDEIPHLRFTLYVKEHHALPILPFHARNDTVLMGHHPPLYYILAAILVTPLDTTDLRVALPPNPHFIWIEGYGPGNRNVFLHSPVTGQDPWPYRRIILAIHVLRLFSTLLGVAALLASRALVRRLIPGSEALVLAATALFALFLRYSILVAGVGHGRFFIAILPILASAMVIGLSKLTPRRMPLLPFALAATMLSYGVLAPFLIIIPAYQSPVVASASSGSDAAPIAVFGNELNVVGTRLDPAVVRPGGASRLTIMWSRSAPISADLRFRARVVARDGTVFFDKEYWLAGGGVPTNTWPAGVTYRDIVVIPVPSNVTPGRARAYLSVGPANGTWWLDQTGRREVRVGQLALSAAHTLARIPDGARAVGAVFERGLELVSAEVEPLAQPASRVKVTLFWRANRRIDEDLTVSVRALDAADKLVGQSDGETAGGLAPTSTWGPGHLIVDSHQVDLPTVHPDPPFRIVVILYRRPSLQRLSVVSSGVHGDLVALGAVGKGGEFGP